MQRPTRPTSDYSKAVCMRAWIENFKASRWYRRLREARSGLKRIRRREKARLMRLRSDAKFIAVTGSSGKTTTVALLSHILSAVAKTRTQVNANLPNTTWRTLAELRQPEYVVMEIGTSKPGNIRTAARVARPHVGIVTMVGLEHLTAFRSKEAVAREKSALVESLPAKGIAILNADDPNVAAMTDRTKARIITFGKETADYTFSDVRSDGPGRLSFTLNYSNGCLPLKTQLTGAHNAMPVSAAAACALELGVPEAVVAERVASYKAYFGRLSVHHVENGPTFILDTVKAPYGTLLLALDVLRECTAPRRRFVLGTISDYVGNPRPKYRDTYREALKFADQVIFVGDHCRKSRATEEEIAAGKFMGFPNVRDASHYIRETAVPGEIILVKSSRNLHLERLMFDCIADVQCWPNVCGVDNECLGCGLYTKPFHEHGGRAPKSS